MFKVVFCLAYFVVNYLNVSFHGLMTSVEEEKSFFPLSIACNFVVYVRLLVILWFMFILLVIRILLWHTLGLPIYYFVTINNTLLGT